MHIDTSVVLGPWADGTAPAWTVPTVLEHLDRHGAQFASVRSTWSLHYDPAYGNRRLVETIGAEERLIPSFVLGPLESGEFGPADGLGARLRERGARSVWLCPARHGWSLRGREAQRLLGAVEESRLPVFLELDDAPWSDIDELCARLPETDIVLSAVGYRGLRPLLATMAEHPRLHVDLSYLGSMGGLELLASRFGAERIVLGTGAPLRDAHAPWHQVAASRLDPAQRELVLGGNAARILGLTGSSGPDGVVAAPLEAPPVPVIDIHAHIGRWPNTWIPEPDAVALVERSRRVGIVHSAVSGLEGIWADTVTGNERVLQAVAAHEGALSALLVADPHEHANADLLREQLSRRGVRGIKIHPDTHRCAIDDRRYEWIWELALAAGVPVLAHGYAGNDTSDPRLFAAVAERHPDLALIIGHSGATYDGFVRTIEVGASHPNLHAEICGSWMTGWWIRRLVDELGAARVVHGTDACLIDPALSVGRVLGAGLDRAALAAVLAENARRLLRLPADGPSSS